MGTVAILAQGKSLYLLSHVPKVGCIGSNAVVIEFYGPW